ncbi:hypothetical protein AAG906_037488 [Vitis piasezkii]
MLCTYKEYDIGIGVEDDPIMFSQAMGGNESTLWYNAMKDEMNSMANNQVWDLVELPKCAKVIGCKWVFKTKRDSSGNIERYKARLKDSFWIIMALVAHFDMELHQMDVKTTFLNGDLEEEVYMKQPEGFITNGNDHIVCKLKKSIYGLKQASRQWYLKFHDVISSFGFIENVMDQCIYHKVGESKIIFLVLYLDDVLLASNDLGLLHEIERDRSQWILGLSQETYINKVLERFRMKDCSPGTAPIVKSENFSLNQCPSNDLEKKEMKNIPYASTVGSLMYAQVCTRPDISYAIGMLGRYQSNPVMRYLKGTRDYKLTYRKSTSGYVFLLAGGAISWRSAKQTLVATSTTEAKFVSCFEATSQAIWMRSFISGLQVVDSISKPVGIYYDNSVAMFLAKNNKSGSRSKHIDIKYLAIREHVKSNKVAIEHISTRLTITNPLTKGLPPKAYKEHVEHMGLNSVL